MTVQAIAVLLLAVAGLQASLSLPLIKRKIPPNWWYGFRTTATVHDPSLWYSTNQYAGRYLLLSSTIQAATAVGLILLRDRLSPASAASIALAVLLLTSALLIARSRLFLSRLRKGRQ